MTYTQWFVFFIVVQLIHFLGTWKLYQKADRKSWEAAIPVYNAIVLFKIIKRPTWWTILLFIPIINLIVFGVIWVQTLRNFGKKSFFDAILGLITCGGYILYLQYTADLKYEENKDEKPISFLADLFGSLLFAVVVATFVHTYFIQPFIIPTSSLEKSLLVGDFLFVSKSNYGARVPTTAVAFPMVHDTLPLVKKKSYLNSPQIPYMRLWGYEKIKHSDIVCFNWPVDTVSRFRDNSGIRYDKPIDKKSNYVKRCVGLPGDKLEIKDGIVFIDNKELILPERAKPQYSYRAKLIKQEGIDYQNLFLDLNQYDKGGQISDSDLYFPALTDDNVIKLKKISGVIDVKKNIDTSNVNFNYDFKYNPNIKDGFLDVINRIKLSEKYRIVENGKNTLRIYYPPIELVNLLSKYKSVESYKEIYEIFPHSIYQKNWTRDNYGPIYVPQVGKTISLNLRSLSLYKRIITKYEGNKLNIVGNDIYINDKKVTNYTFKQNYYWMMGDNRHNSEDSRYWGFVPEDHIVGKPVFIWMSIENFTQGPKNWKVRWDRVFTTVSGDGQPQSYFRYFLAFLVVYFIGEYFWIKRKKKV